MNHFIEPSYKPLSSDVLVHYQISVPYGISFHEYSHRLLSELSLASQYYNGPGSELKPRIYQLQPHHNQLRIAYPGGLFEPGNISQQLSIIALSFFDIPHLKNTKLLEIQWPSHLQAALPGPSGGIKKIRKLLGIPHRPISSVVLRPKAAAPTKDIMEKAYHIWIGGCDIVMESEFMASPDHSNYEERISFLSSEQNNCTERSGRIKCYIPNITAGSLAEMKRRAYLAGKEGLSHVVINAFPVGLVGIRSLRDICAEFGLTLWAHRIGYQQHTEYPDGSIAPHLLALIFRHLGIDALSIGTEISANSLLSAGALNNQFHPQAENQLESFPICSDITDLDQVEDLIKHFGHDIVLQTSETVYAHPDGIRAGAEAFQYAIESATQGVNRDHAATKNNALRHALESAKLNRKTNKPLKSAQRKKKTIPVNALQEEF